VAGAVVSNMLRTGILEWVGLVMPMLGAAMEAWRVVLGTSSPTSSMLRTGDIAIPAGLPDRAGPDALADRPEGCLPSRRAIISRRSSSKAASRDILVFLGCTQTVQLASDVVTTTTWRPSP